MKVRALETYRNRLLKDRDRWTSTEDSEIISAQAHLAMHYIARAKLVVDYMRRLGQ